VALGAGAIVLAVWRDKRKTEVVVRKLAWPASVNSHYSIGQDGHSLNVSCEQLGLLQLGSLKGDQDLEFSADLHQLTWSGGIGLFLGHQAGGTKTSPKGSFLAVFLFREPNNNALSLQLSEKSFVPTDPQGTDTRGFGEIALGAISGDTLRLTLRVQSGRLAEILLDGAAPADAAALIARTSTIPCIGPFGLYMRRSTGVYTNVAIDGHTLTLAHDASSP
jgi:hypothetical protein